ncbi:MAG: exopolysaccharide transporter [Bacteroidetes bacterium]|nr:MAG: exopolysaccharide transporter [Bacteroidota bacterium]
MDHSKFLKRVDSLLLIVLFIMVAGFFTWSENIVITRVIKVVTRIGMTVAIYFVHQKIVNYGAIRSFNWSHIWAPIFYVGYLLLGLASIMWSTDPGYSSLQWVMTLESFVFAFYFMKCYMLLDEYFPNHHIRFYNTMGNTVFGLILIFIIGMYIDHDVFFRAVEGGADFRLGGYIMNPNELGMLAGLGLSCLIFDLYRKPKKIWTIIKVVIILWALVLTKSRSSLVGVLLIVFFHVRRSNSTKLKLAVYVAIAAIIPIVIQTLVLRSGGLEDILSMTGRLPFWKALIAEGLPREPLFGFGFMRIDYHDHFESVHTYAGHMTHNTFLQVLMNLGFVGFTIVLFQMFFTIRGFTKQLEEKKLMLLGILIPVMINSMTEFGIFGEANFGILFYHFLIFSITFSKPDRLTKVQQLFLKRRRPDISFG